MRNFAPFQIGKYQVVEVIARGGMGAVYRGIQRGAGSFTRGVAIKEILPEFVSKPEMRKRFEFEAHICSQLNHPNIVQIFDFIYHEGAFFLVMELIRGLTLKALISKIDELGYEFPPELSLYIISETLKGVRYAHEAKNAQNQSLKIIHRDLSPHNIMISTDGTVKIVDFGLAQADNNHGLSKTGSIKGKLAYMSPEQAEGKSLGTQADLYSVAIIFYELLTGKPLFDAHNDMELWRLVINPKITPIQSVTESVSTDISEIMMAALDPNPATRLDNADKFLRVLQNHLSRNYPDFGSKHLSQLMTLVHKESPNKDDQGFRNTPRPTPYPPSFTERDSTPPKLNFLFNTILSVFVLSTLYFGYRFAKTKWFHYKESIANYRQLSNLSPKKTNSESLDSQNTKTKSSRVKIPGNNFIPAEPNHPTQLVLTKNPGSASGGIEFEWADSNGKIGGGEGCSLTQQSPLCLPIQLSGVAPFKIKLRGVALMGGPPVVYSQRNCLQILKGQFNPSEGSCEFWLNENQQISVWFDKK